MPPRKRAASAPKDETEQEQQTPETEGQQIELSDEAPASDGGSAPADGGTAQEPAGDDADQADEEDHEDERSDLQSAEMPCGECFPNGWPEGAFSVGCTHGTYVRKQD